MTCKNCKFSKKTPTKKTRLQAWQEDPRPIATRWWHEWSNDYKEPSPYTDYWDKAIDQGILQDNETSYSCCRYPKRRYVHADYYCGEYQDIKQKWQESDNLTNVEPNKNTDSKTQP